MRGRAEERGVVLRDDVELFVDLANSVGAALAEHETIGDVCPARCVVGEDANTDLVLAGSAVDAELEVVGCKGAVAFEDVGKEVRKRAVADLCGFEVVVKDVFASLRGDEAELFAGRTGFVINRHPSSPRALRWRGA